MGALAITVLAGARIVEMADTPMVAVTRDLIAAGWWRHVQRRVPLSYEATLWSMVFPLGMYGVAGIYLGRADRLPVVESIGRGELWVALAVWLVVFVAMLGHLVNTVVRAEGEPQTAG